MLISGAEKLKRMRDGRVVFIGSQRVDDVTVHPAFAGGAKAVADFYDQKASAEHASDLTYQENGAIHSIWWKRPTTREDLSRRMRGSKALADMTFGFFGRSPDHIGSLVTGLAMNPLVLDRLQEGRGENLMCYYERARDDDIYLTYAVTPPSGLRSGEATPGSKLTHPSLRVVREEGPRGPDLPAQQRSKIPRDLSRDARQLPREPPVELSLLGEDVANCRPSEPNVHGQRRRQDPRGA